MGARDLIRSDGSKKPTGSYEGLRREELLQLLERRDSAEAGGLRLTYAGQTAPWQIVRRVQPRRQRIDKKLSVGTEEEQSSNIIVEGENLQAMVSLYKYRGQVDLILTDPPYNTGLDFRYNDKWDEDPNDPELGSLVPSDDGSRHCKWLRFMTPRIWMMREMLKPSGVLAICIDHRELFRIGMLLDDIFGEDNRIGIINWQKAFSPKNSSKHISTATEYVLIYSKNIENAVTGLLPRDDALDRTFRNRDNDPEGDWNGKDPTARESRRNTGFAIQSPFTGSLHYPGGEYRFSGDLPDSNFHWRGMSKAEMKVELEKWGVAFQERDLGDRRGRALVVAGSRVSLRGYDPASDPVISDASKKAFAIRQAEVWPKLYFRDDQSTPDGAQGRPRLKSYLKYIKQGKVPLTYWADEDYTTPIVLGSQSWNHSESGHSKSGLDELDAMVGRNHGFQTVKPLKLFKKIVQLWCPPNGIVLDPFAGSGTAGHAVVELNTETSSHRRFVLIEQGRPERGDRYASTLTQTRLRRAISGERIDRLGKAQISAQPASAGFRFVRLLDRIDGEAVLALEREEMLDLLLTSHWDQTERSSTHLQRLAAGSYKYLFGVSSHGEGYFLVWNGPDGPSVLSREAFRVIADEAKRNGLRQPFHVYARVCSYSGPNIEFYQIPNRILEKLGFNESTDPYESAVSNS